MLFAVLVVFLFNPLLGWLEGIVDRYIYQQDYNPEKVHAEVSLVPTHFGRRAGFS
jgi:hypothetical protein